MRSLMLGAVAALSLLSAPALAQSAAKVGATVKTSDGKKLGRIYAIDGGQTAVILKDGKSIKVAVSTLSGEGNSLTTSLSSADLKK